MCRDRGPLAAKLSKVVKKKYSKLIFVLYLVELLVPLRKCRIYIPDEPIYLFIFNYFHLHLKTKYQGIEVWNLREQNCSMGSYFSYFTGKTDSSISVTSEMDLVSA